VRELIREILQSGWFHLTKDDMKRMLDKERSDKRYKWQSSNVEWALDHYLDRMRDDEEEFLTVKDPQTDKVHQFSWKEIAYRDIQQVENIVNNELYAIKKIIGDFYYDKENLITSIFSQEELNVEDLYPFPIYLSKSNDMGDGIGVMCLGGGKYEMFDENEESTPETYQDLNNKWMRIYAAHNDQLVEKIRETKKLPKDLYVSPDIDVAKGYWSTTEQRVLFTAMVNMSDIRMESSIDWKTANEASVKKFSILANL
jgi:hypothetical protein